MQDIFAWVSATFGPNPDYKQVLLTLMTPLFLIGVGLEWWYQTRVRKRTQDYYWKDTLVNVALGTGYQIAEAVTWLLFTGAIMLWVYQYRLFDIPVNVWTAVPIFVFVETQAEEVRIFPLTELGARPSRHLKQVIEACMQAKLNPRIVTVNYEFQKGANRMLLLSTT